MAESPPTSLSQVMVREYFPESAGELILGGVAARELAQRFGTPLYVFDAAVLRRRVEAVRAALGPRVEVLYALKANPNAAVTRLLHRAGTGAEVASAGEIAVARAAGVPGDRIHFAGPGKDLHDLDAAREHGLFSLNVESEAEYDAIVRHSHRRRYRPGLALRVNPPMAVSGSRMKMGGGSQKFGIDANEVPALVRRIHADGRAEFRGLHIYAGTQCFDSDAWIGNARFLLGLAHRIEHDTGVAVRTLNFGGGFGVPCFDGDVTFDLSAAGESIRGLIEDDARPDRRYFVELGRYLTAPAGVYLTRVLYLKTARDRRHAILDGGLHQHSAAAGVGAIIKRAFPFVVCDRLGDAGASQTYCLGGPLCTPADELAAAVRLPPLDQGDLIGILSSGAYGLTFSNTMFLGHPAPAEVLVDGGQARVVRERGRVEDTLRGQLLPD